MAVVLSFLLVFRADLAYTRYEQGKAALGTVHGGIRNLNLAFVTFLRHRSQPTSIDHLQDGGMKVGRVTKIINPGAKLADAALAELRMARDRMELFRLTNLLYAFVRQAVRGQRHGYSDVGPVTDEELMLRDRGGKPRVPDIIKDDEEMEEFRKLEPWNRPNVVVSKITALIEHHRRKGNLGERACLDVFRDCQVVLDALKSAERIVTTPIPYQYLHMLNILLFFFVYSVPFVFTANFKWMTPFPSVVIALAFFGVNEIGRCMEDPFSWNEPCHDISGNGWRIYRENLQVHEQVEAVEQAALTAEVDDNEASVIEVTTKPTSAANKIRAAVAKTPLGNVLAHAKAVDDSCAMDDLTVAEFNTSNPVPPALAASPQPVLRNQRRRTSSAASVSGPFTGNAVQAVQRESHAPIIDGALANIEDGDGDGDRDDSEAMTVDPGMLPKDLSTHWSGFIRDVFVFKNTVMPSLFPQIILSFALGILAQVIKINVCGAGIVAAAECSTTFDITAHQIVSVSLGFLLVFRTDWAYDRYYEGKQAMGQLYSGLRNLNVCFVNYLRINKSGERAAAIAARKDAGEGSGTVSMSPSHASATATSAKIVEDRTELLRLTNVFFATTRHVLRELRVGSKSGERMSCEDCVTEDSTGKPPLPDLLHKGEATKLLALMPTNRVNWVAMRIQIITETHRRLGNISERAAFEIYQQLEICLSAWKSMERIVSTPIPFTYLHMVQFILFFFVFSAPFVFTTTFHWIAYIPSVIVAIGFYGINEMGKLLQDPFNWTHPCHDLSGLGLRIYRENLKIHENAAEKDAKTTADEKGGAEGSFLKVLNEALQRQDSHDSLSEEQGTLSQKRSWTIHKSPKSSIGSNATIVHKIIRAQSMFTKEPAVNSVRGMPEIYGKELNSGPFAFITCLFSFHKTVLPRVMPQTIFAAIVALIAQIVKISWCGANITSPSECPLAFNQTAHSVAGGIIGFMLVFRTSIAYYRFYEGKKHLGQLYDSIRNANIAFCSFLRSAEDEAMFQAAGGNGDDTGVSAASFNITLNNDRIELRRLSNILYAFIRQAIREHRHGYPEGTPKVPTDVNLVEDDLFGRPSLGLLLSDKEKSEFKAIDFNNRANIVVWKMQSIVEHHRRLGHISHRGAFDIYHDLEGCLEAYKHMERIVSTKMPFQYLHMVNFLLFIFVFSAPFVFTTGFKWLSPVPSCIVAISFYGVAEIARSIEDPYSWIKPCHDLSGVGWRLYSETLQLHESSVADVDAAAVDVDETDTKYRSHVYSNAVHSSHSRCIEKGDAGVEKGAASPLRRSVAHGEFDVWILSSSQPSTEDDILTSLKRTAEIEPSAVKDVKKNSEEEFGTSSPDLAQVGSVVGTMAVANCREVEAMKHKPPELVDSWHGFITDIFRLRSTIHQEVIPQVLLAFIISWIAQFLKLARCGGNVQEAFECPVTFDVYAHQVLGAVLAFMIVYRFKFAYDRYYEAKTAIGELHCGLRNFNIGVCAFLHPGRESELSYSAADTEKPWKKTVMLLQERTELLRLSGMLYGFIRHVLREQRLGYPDEPSPGDKQLLMQDTYGKPSMGSLFRDAKEIADYSRVPFQNRPNMVVTRIQSIVEHHRRLGHICERGAFDLYHECEIVLTALKSCERIVTTPIPFQYIQMCHFVTFFFTYSAPFIFTVSYQYISFFPSCLLAMAFYGINCIGEVMERPFNWQEPNHDLTGVGFRVWRESTQLHRRCAERDTDEMKDVSAGGADHHVKAIEALNRLVERGATQPDFESLLKEHEELQQTFRKRRASAADMAAALASEEYPRHGFSFLFGLLGGRNNVLKKVMPQIILAGVGGVVAQMAKIVMCGQNVKLSSECSVTFHTEAHAICGAVIGFLLVYCANIAYVKFYEAKSAVGDIYHGLRNMNIAFATFLRPPIKGEPGHWDNDGETGDGEDQGHSNSSAMSVRDDQVELRRLSNVLFAFIRQALREQRHGYCHDFRRRRASSHLEEFEAQSTSWSVWNLFSGDGKWKSEARGGGTGPPGDESLLSEDLCGDPGLSMLLSLDERKRYMSVDASNRFNVVMAEIHRIVEKLRRNGNIYEKAAFEVYRECDAVLAAYKTCERIITTPIPYQYTHMVNLVLFFFVFSAPLIFTVTFKWITPFPSAILALGFYGIWEVGKTMMDPFDWNEPCIDLTAVARRINSEAERIYNAGQYRYSIFSNELNAFMTRGTDEVGGRGGCVTDTRRRSGKEKKRVSFRCRDSEVSDNNPPGTVSD